MTGISGQIAMASSNKTRTRARYRSFAPHDAPMLGSGKVAVDGIQTDMRTRA